MIIMIAFIVIAVIRYPHHLKATHESKLVEALAAHICIYIYIHVCMYYIYIYIYLFIACFRTVRVSPETSEASTPSRGEALRRRDM